MSSASLRLVRYFTVHTSHFPLTHVTGSGKTAAYLIPIISKLMGKVKKLRAPRPDTTRSFDARSHGVRAEPLVVIVVPTRELAIQIFDEARRMCYRSMLRPCVAYGGYPMGACLEELAKGCDILIGTPGRLCDLMDRPDKLTMSRVKFTVIDEADEMLDTDWEEELNKLMAGGGMSYTPLHVRTRADLPIRYQRRCRPRLHDVFSHFPQGRA